VEKLYSIQLYDRVVNPIQKFFEKRAHSPYCDTKTDYRVLEPCYIPCMFINCINCGGCIADSYELFSKVFERVFKHILSQDAHLPAEKFRSARKNHIWKI
jgi:hypothetical protein